MYASRRASLSACRPRRRPTRRRSSPIASRTSGNGRRGVEPALDDVLPPALGVVVAAGLGQRGQRVTAGQPAAGARVRAVAAGPASSRSTADGPSGVVVVERPARPRPRRVLVVGLVEQRPLARGEGGRGGQVAEADLDVVPPGPADRLPLGREAGERPEGRDPRLLGRVREQRDGRHQVVVARRSAAAGRRRAAPRRARSPARTRPGRATSERAEPGPVVADAEDLDRRAARGRRLRGGPVPVLRLERGDQAHVPSRHAS